jgi:queuine tRNA-ribosyltransferase
MHELILPNGIIRLPEFLPDATRGVVRSLDAADLEASGIQALVMNTFHLMQNPGSSTIQALGGIHRMSGWQRPIITDSGGFQIYSLIRQNPKFGTLSKKGATFRSEGTDRKFNLTPEKSIQLQLGYGSDIVVCLDDCTHVDDPYEVQSESVRRTIDWAKRSKNEFLRLVREKNFPEGKHPFIFGVIQGGGYAELRTHCAQALLEIGFDGYGYGGWPLDGEGNLLVEMLAHTRSLVPVEFPMHALGVAHPKNVAACARMGYELSDGAMPTRDARHGRLYRYNVDPAVGERLAGNWFSFLYILDDKHIRAASGVSPFCDCLLCTRYSVGYLHHLFKVKDTLAYRLATIHNLSFMSQLTANLRGELHGQ